MNIHTQFFEFRDTPEQEHYRLTTLHELDLTVNRFKRLLSECEKLSRTFPHFRDLKSLIDMVSEERLTLNSLQYQNLETINSHCKVYNKNHQVLSNRLKKIKLLLK